VQIQLAGGGWQNIAPDVKDTPALAGLAPGPRLLMVHAITLYAAVGGQGTHAQRAEKIAASCAETLRWA